MIEEQGNPIRQRESLASARFALGCNFEDKDWLLRSEAAISVISLVIFDYFLPVLASTPEWES